MSLADAIEMLLLWIVVGHWREGRMLTRDNSDGRNMVECNVTFILSALTPPLAFLLMFKIN